MSDQDPLLQIVLIEPEIPQNTGSIGRLCVGTRCRLHLVKPLGFDISEKAVRRAGLDYWHEVDLRVHETLDDLFTCLEGVPLSLTSAQYGRPYTAHRFVRGQAILFGRESVGLPRDLLTRYREQCIRIPTLGPIRSLNLSNAASVVVYEGLRQLEPAVFYPAGEGL